MHAGHGPAERDPASLGDDHHFQPSRSVNWDPFPRHRRGPCPGWRRADVIDIETDDAVVGVDRVVDPLGEHTRGARHSSRRRRGLVRTPAQPAGDAQEQPVTNRIRIPKKHSGSVSSVDDIPTDADPPPPVTVAPSQPQRPLNGVKCVLAPPPDRRLGTGSRARRRRPVPFGQHRQLRSRRRATRGALGNGGRVRRRRDTRRSTRRRDRRCRRRSEVGERGEAGLDRETLGVGRDAQLRRVRSRWRRRRRPRSRRGRTPSAWRPIPVPTSSDAPRAASR